MLSLAVAHPRSYISSSHCCDHDSSETSPVGLSFYLYTTRLSEIPSSCLAAWPLPPCLPALGNPSRAPEVTHPPVYHSSCTASGCLSWTPGDSHLVTWPSKPRSLIQSLRIPGEKHSLAPAGSLPSKGSETPSPGPAVGHMLSCSLRPKGPYSQH